MKKLLSIIMTSLFILNLSSCEVKENPLVIEGYADAENFTICSAHYTPDHPFNKYLFSDRITEKYYQKEDIDPKRKITLDKKTYTLIYKESAHYDFYDADIYYSEDESFSVTYYSGTTTIVSIRSVYLEKLEKSEKLEKTESPFPLEALFSIEAKFATEEDYINYSRQLAEILGVDISDSYTQGYTYTGYPLYDGKGFLTTDQLHGKEFLTDDQLNGMKAKQRGMDWVKPYKNGLICHTGKFSIRCKYISTDSGEDKPILTSISFPVPLPEDAFQISEEEIKELIKSVHGEDFPFEIVEYRYKVVCTNLLSLHVAYSCINAFGNPVTLGAYIFPEDTVIPE
jgi:hypothetical protein